MKQTYYMETYGCQMNKAESDAISIILTEHGWKAVEEAAEARIIILNTCSVRKTAEDRVWGRIGALKGFRNRGVKLIIMGCMAERLKEEIFKREPAVDLVVCNFDKKNLPGILDQLQSKGSHILSNQEKEYQFLQLHEQELSGFKSFIPIMHGCNNFCSYCIVPYVRGREISRPPDSILKEIDQLNNRGIKEITLLGQNVNSYHYAFGEKDLDFTSLLKLIDQNKQGIKWIRFLTSHPKDFPMELIDVIAQSDSICKHIHLPVQHGSDNILKKMERKYSRKDYFKIIESLKKKIPQVSITSDILIGFPGETEEDFRDTLNLMQEIQFDDAFTYRYNRIEGTKAYHMDDQLSEETKLERLNQIIELQRQIVKRKKENKINQTMDALVESVSKHNPNELLARSEFDDMIIFSGDKADIGNIKKLKITRLKGNTLFGSVVSE